jgi:hypothetical protein
MEQLQQIQSRTNFAPQEVDPVKTRKAYVYVVAASIATSFAQQGVIDIPESFKATSASRERATAIPQSAAHSQFSPVIPVDDQRPIANGEAGPAVVASTAEGFFAVWRGGLRGTRISKTGEILDVGGIPLLQTDHTASSASIASDGTNCMVVLQLSWGVQNWIAAVRIVNGRPSPSFLVTTNGVEPSVAFASGQYLVVWNNENVAYQPRITVGRRFSITGDPLDTEPFVIHQTTEGIWNLKVAGKPGRFLVAWTQIRSDANPPQGNADVFGAYVDPQTTAQVSDAFLIHASLNREFLNAVTSDGKTFLVLWNTSDRGSLGFEDAEDALYGTVLDESGILASESRLADGMNASAAAVPAGYVVAFQTPIWPPTIGGSWLDESKWNVSTMVISPSGVPLTLPIELASADGPDLLPQIASDGTNCFVTWTSQKSWSAGIIKGTPLSAAGEPAVVNGYPVANRHPPQSTPAVASNGRNFLVAWNDMSRYPEAVTVLAARVSLDGALLDPIPIEISGGKNPSVAACGKNYLVVFDVGGYMGTRLLDSDGRLAAPVMEEPSNDWVGGSPVVAGSDSGFLVVSTQTVYDRSRYGYPGRVRTFLKAMRLNRDGEPIEQQWTVNPGAGTTLSPAVAARGKDYLLTWSEAPESIGPYTLHFSVRGLLARPTGVTNLWDFGAPVTTSLQIPNNQVAACSFGYVLTWTDYVSAMGQLHATFMDPDARPTRKNVVLSSSAARSASPTIGTAVQKVLVAWTEQYGTTNAWVTGACISRNGQIESLGVIDSQIENFDYARVATDARSRVLFVIQRRNQEMGDVGIFATRWTRR